MSTLKNNQNDDLNEDEDSSQSDAHGWNRREHRSPIFWYILLISVCSGIAWILSSMGHG